MEAAAFVPPLPAAGFNAAPRIAAPQRPPRTAASRMGVPRNIGRNALRLAAAAPNQNASRRFACTASMDHPELSWTPPSRRLTSSAEAVVLLKHILHAKIVRTVSRTFERAWRALDEEGARSASCVSQVGQFVEAVAAAYRVGFSPDGLDMELSFYPSPIDATERAVRRILMELAFYTLYRLNFRANGRQFSPNASKLSEEQQGLHELCEHILAAEAQGYDIERLRLEVAFAGEGGRTAEEAEMLTAWLETCFAAIRIARAQRPA